MDNQYSEKFRKLDVLGKPPFYFDRKDLLKIFWLVYYKSFKADLHFEF